jgi:hypothetical protein
MLRRWRRHRQAEERAVERRAAVLITIEALMLAFGAAPRGGPSPLGAATWQVAIYATGLALGLASLASAILVFWPGRKVARQPRLLFSAYALLLGP